MLISNCWIEAKRAKRRNPEGVTVRVVKNRRGLKHWQWIEGGKVYEFYGAGASRRGYLGNLLYRGRILCVGEVSEPRTRTGKRDRTLYAHHQGGKVVMRAYPPPGPRKECACPGCSAIARNGMFCLVHVTPEDRRGPTITLINRRLGSGVGAAR